MVVVVVVAGRGPGAGEAGRGATGEILPDSYGCKR